VTLQDFDKYEVELVGSINPPTKRLGVRYIITMTKHLNRGVKEEPVRDYNAKTTA
jgi:hypothetical protein